MHWREMLPPHHPLHKRKERKMDNWLNTGLGRELLAHLRTIGQGLRELTTEVKRYNDSAEKVEYRVADDKEKLERQLDDTLGEDPSAS